MALRHTDPAGRRVSSRLAVALTLCPIDLALTADGRRKRVLHLKPLIGAAREIGGAELLAYNALTAKRASVLVDARTVAVVSRIEHYAVVRCPQCPSEMLLAFLDWLPPQIGSVDLEHIEGAQSRGTIMTAVTE